TQRTPGRARAKRSHGSPGWRCAAYCSSRQARSCVHATKAPGRSRARRARATVRAGFLWSVNALCTTTRSAFARTVRSRRSMRSASAACPGDAYAFRGPAHPERDARVVRAKIADVDALEPGRERGLDDEALPREVGLEAEDRAEAEEHHARGPGLRDARDEVIGGPRREAEVAREAAEELRQLRVRETPAGLHERAHDLGRLLAEPVARDARHHDDGATR